MRYSGIEIVRAGNGQLVKTAVCQPAPHQFALSNHLRQRSCNDMRHLTSNTAARAARQSEVLQLSLRQRLAPRRCGDRAHQKNRFQLTTPIHGERQQNQGEHSSWPAAKPPCVSRLSNNLCRSSGSARSPLSSGKRPIYPMLPSRWGMTASYGCSVASNAALEPFVPIPCGLSLTASQSQKYPSDFLAPERLRVTYRRWRYLGGPHQ